MKNKKRIIILGTGGHAKLLVDIAEQSGEYEVIGFTDKTRREGEFAGYPVLGDDSILQKYLEEGLTTVAIGVGGFKDNLLRKEIYQRIKKQGFEVATIIHPSCIISPSVIIKEGAVLFAGVTINNDVEIGENTIIATSSTIDHDTIIGSHVLISAGVTIGAYTKIKEGVLCALGAKVISGVEIEKEILIGAGAVVVKDLMEKGLYIGCPAKIKKE